MYEYFILEFFVVVSLVFMYVKKQQLIWIFFRVPLTLSSVTGRRLDYILFFVWIWVSLT